MATVIKTDLPNPVYSGKVRDTYSLGEDHFLMIATDRISAFDVVLPNGVPDKGAVLAQISLFWFDLTKNLIPNHLEKFAMDRTDLDLSKYSVGPKPVPKASLGPTSTGIDAEKREESKPKYPNFRTIQKTSSWFEPVVSSSPHRERPPSVPC